MSQSANNVVRIDSRKFLSSLNDSAQAKIALFEDRVEQMGKALNKNWKLAALHAKDLYIEDVESHKYYVADHIREQHNKVSITNVRPLEIIEEEKQELFTETCTKLVSAIEENDQKGMAAAFDRMKAQRFSGRAVPYSGVVRCKDNVLRRINICQSNASFGESTKVELVRTIVEGLKDRVIVENGSIVSGHFTDGEEVKLPITKWGTRKLVARRMMESAKNAYWSTGFQTRIYNVARLVSEGKIDAAVKAITPFLEEMEEFTLLNRVQVQTLVENSLAAKMVFNQQLCDDTATLFYRTNMKLSRNKIIDEWRSVAKKSEHPVLAENVKKLEESKNFESAYQKFLALIFETISNREVAAEALATTLDILKNKTPKIRESHELSSKLNNLITRLKDKNFDDAAIYEAEDLIATIQEELAATDNLQNFDQIPAAGGPAEGDTQDMDLTGGLEGGSTPVININSPLIQIGGQSSAATDAAGGAPPEEEVPAPGGDEDLDALLGAGGPPAAPPPGGAGGPAPGGPAAPPPGAPPMEGKRKSKSLSESRPVHFEMSDETDDDKSDEEEIEEGYDPYAIMPAEKISLKEGLHITNYGAPIITDEGDLEKIIRIMRQLATENRLTGKALEHNLPRMAQSTLNALKIRIPESKMPRALEQVITYFMESESDDESGKPFPGAAPPFGSKSDDSSDSDDSSGSEGSDDSDSSGGESKKPWETGGDDEGVAEDQFHGPSIPNRGLGRAKIVAKEGKIKWTEKQNDAILGEYAGVNFIFDHGGEDENLAPIILSEDGSVEIPIPKFLYDNAFAAARMSDGDSRPFVKWLSESIEQLRPITSEEDLALNEAMARITTGPDGSINVEVSDEIPVSDLGAGGMDDGMGMGDPESPDAALAADAEATADEFSDMPADEEGDSPDAMMGADEGGGPEDDMAAVDSVAPVSGGAPQGPPSGGSEGDDSMPNFDNHDDNMRDEEGMAEDKDITSPQNASYTKHVKENLRDMPTPKMPKANDDELEDIGPTLKKDDGTGTKPPTAKKGD